jgi:hypothetical protein
VNALLTESAIDKARSQSVSGIGVDESLQFNSKWSKGLNKSFSCCTSRYHPPSAREWLNTAIFPTSHNYEVSATPCTESETAHAPSSGVAETLLHEPAGSESSYGDLMMVVAAGDRARFS